MHAVIKAEGNRGIARSLTCRKSLDFRRSEVKVCITTDEDEYLGNWSSKIYFHVVQHCCLKVS